LPRPRVSITAQVSAAANQALQGVGCWRDPAHGYLFMTSTDGTFAILRQSVPGIGTPARVAVGWDPGAAYAEQGTTLAASCAAGPRGTVLSFAIGGRPVARVTDRNGLGRFNRAGFTVVDLGDSPVTAQFDDLHIATPRPPRPAPDHVATADRLLFDTFHDGRRWFTGVDGGVAGGVSGGSYQLSVSHGYQVMEPTNQLPHAVDSLYVGADLRDTGPGGAPGGVTCSTGGTTGWAFVVQPDGHYAIRDIRDDRELAAGNLPQPPTGRVRLGGLCERGPDGIRLGLDIGRVRVATATVDGGSGPFTQAGVYLFGTPGARASFEVFEAAAVGSAGRG
jgi:hypothetical protein